MRTLLLCLVISLSVISTAMAQPQNGLVAYYPFSGNANDASGNGLNGTVMNGAALTADRFGNANNAYHFDGVSQYIRVGDNNLLDTGDGQSVSIGLWVRTSDYSNWCAISKYRSVPIRGGWHIATDNNSLYFGGRDRWDYRYSGVAPSISDGQWHHVVGMRAGSVWSIWVDGCLKSSSDAGNTTAMDNNEFMVIGACIDVGILSNYLDGDLDEVRVYNRALTPNEIFTLAEREPVSCHEFNDLCGWTLYGDPLPQWLPSVHGRNGIFDNNGDPMYNSGAISNQTYDLSQGFVIESDVYLDFYNLSGCWASAAIGIANQAEQWWGGFDAHIYFDLAGAGDACWATPPELRRHAYIYGGYTTDSGTESFGDIDGVHQINADVYANGWHTLKIEAGPNLVPSFYIDNTLVYAGTLPVAASAGSAPQPLWLGDRSSGSAGKAYHDRICFTVPEPCDQETACNIPAGVYRTETHGAWGQDHCHGNNFACTRDQNFAQAFPSGLTVGGGYTIHFTSSAAIGEFLPNGGRISTLDASYTDPAPGIPGGTFASQVVALALNVGFGQAAAASFSDLRTLVVREGPFAHSSVADVLALANQVLGGDVDALPTSTTLQDLHSTIASINENFENGTVSQGYLVEGCCEFGNRPAPEKPREPRAARDIGSFEVNLNPFNPTAEIRYHLNVAGDYSLKVYNIMGQEVATLFSGHANAGNYTLTWNGRSSSSVPVTTGQYFVRLASRNDAAVRKVLMVR